DRVPAYPRGQGGRLDSPRARRARAVALAGPRVMARPASRLVALLVARLVPAGRQVAGVPVQGVAARAGQDLSVLRQGTKDRANTHFTNTRVVSRRRRSCVFARRQMAGIPSFNQHDGP